MEKFQLITEYSPWFAILCILAGLGYAFLLYQKKGPWNNTLNKVLFSFRFVLITALCLLLLGPLARFIKNYIESPTVVFAIDNSQSIEYGTDSLSLAEFRKNLNILSENLKKENIKTEFYFLDNAENTSSDFKFTAASTDLSKILKDIRSDFENRNISAIIMASDGIFNQGISPVHSHHHVPIYTIGLGDTIAKKDLNLKKVFYNKIAYAGNKFPIVAEIHNTGYEGKETTIFLKQNNKILDRKTLRFSREQDVQEVEFYLSSEKSGMQHYTIEVAPLEGEYTTKNNLSHAYVDVIEGRERILILALTPHPDIKALKSALESKENYQVEVHIPGINKFKEEKYDLVIYHQIPDYSNSAQALLDKFLNKTSSLFIVGNQTNLQKFNEINSLVSVNSRSWQKDHVSPVFNSSFERFKFKTEEYTVLNKYPPLTVPYGDFTTKENAETILFQKVGNLTTNKPLVLINKDASEFKSGVIAGEGIWQWRMNEFAETGETKAFDKFFTSLSQYLSSKEDKRKFRFYPVSNEFMTTDRILFETEVYNSVYEKVYGQKININITNEEGNTTSYSFVNSEAESRFEVKGLSQGIYKFSASLERGEKGDKVNGEFLIRELALEAMDVTADHALLRALSEQTGGSFTGPLEMASLSEIISKEKAKSIIHSNEEFNEIINLHWLLIILIMLASMEWFVRKYKGGY